MKASWVLVPVLVFIVVFGFFVSVAYTDFETQYWLDKIGRDLVFYFENLGGEVRVSEISPFVYMEEPGIQNTLAAKKGSQYLYFFTFSGIVVEVNTPDGKTIKLSGSQLWGSSIPKGSTITKVILDPMKAKSNWVIAAEEWQRSGSAWYYKKDIVVKVPKVAVLIYYWDKTISKEGKTPPQDVVSYFWTDYSYPPYVWWTDVETKGWFSDQNVFVKVVDLPKPWELERTVYTELPVNYFVSKSTKADEFIVISLSPYTTWSAYVNPIYLPTDPPSDPWVKNFWHYNTISSKISGFPKYLPTFSAAFSVGQSEKPEATVDITEIIAATIMAAIAAAISAAVTYAFRAR